MQDVKVTMAPPAKPVVSEKIEWGKPNETIDWYFVVTDQRIKKVRIKFKNARARFFTDKNGKSRNWYEQEVVDGHSRIYGKVPKYGKNAPTSEKYTVYGIGANRRVITSLDPSVIIDEP